MFMMYMKFSRNIQEMFITRIGFQKFLLIYSFKLKHFFPFFADHGHSSFAILNGVEVKISDKFRPPEPVSKESFLNLNELINFSIGNHQKTFGFSDDFRENRS